MLEVLEAAHLTPHARGGAASSENGRLLCESHHRAFDARLYQWMGTGSPAWGKEMSPFQDSGGVTDHVVLRVTHAH